MDIAGGIFKRRKVSLPRLLAYGFTESGGAYFYQTALPGSGFRMTVEVTPDGGVKTAVTDAESGEPYTLHLSGGAIGSFVGGVREDYERTLADIAEKCFEPDVFKSAQARALIAYVREKYGDELEFLWQKFPDNAVWRRKDTQKWYGIILTVPRSKLGLASHETAEIIDLRLVPERMAATVDNERYFPGWHMNKKSWYTMLLDGSVPTEELCRRIDESHTLAVK